MNSNEIFFVLEHKNCEGVFIGLINGRMRCVPHIDDALQFREYRKAKDYKARYLIHSGCDYRVRMITSDGLWHYKKALICQRAAEYINDNYLTKHELRYLAADVEVTEEVLNALYGTHMITEYFPRSYFNNIFTIPGFNIIKKVIFNDPATIILWKDGSKTVVKAQDGETYDPEKGLAMAISKKALGNQGNYYDVFKKHLPKEEPEDTSNIDKFYGVEAYLIKKGKDKTYRCSNCNRFISNETVKLTRLNILSPCPHCGKMLAHRGK